MVRQRHDDGGTNGGPSTKGTELGDLSAALRPGEREDLALRPRRFDEYIGQKDLCQNLRVFVKATLERGEPLDHMLFAGPPGLGKTTLARVIANELNAQIVATSGPAVDHAGKLASLLTRLGDRDVLFIDEIHRLTPVVEENLYPAMEDGRIDLFLGDGPHAQAVTVPLARFTLIGATTRTGLLTAPLLNRFGYVAELGFYDVSELTVIVSRSARLLGVTLDPDGAEEIGRRARGTPRIANRLLRRVRDFAQVDGAKTVGAELANRALQRLGVDKAGLDAMDRAILRTIIDRFDGGPVGIEALAAALAQERDTIEDVYEPFLAQQGFVARTPRGRVALARTYEHLGLPQPQPGRAQRSLF
jgi:Holliday junction DNA helicase RuvB